MLMKGCVRQQITNRRCFSKLHDMCSILQGDARSLAFDILMFFFLCDGRKRKTSSQSKYIQVLNGEICELQGEVRVIATCVLQHLKRNHTRGQTATLTF